MRLAGNVSPSRCVTQSSPCAVISSRSTPASNPALLVAVPAEVPTATMRGLLSREHLDEGQARWSESLDGGSSVGHVEAERIERVEARPRDQRVVVDRRARGSCDRSDARSSAVTTLL